MKKRILYIFVVSLIAFLLWVGGVLIMMFRFPDTVTWTMVRVWALIVFIAASVWNCMHFYRKEKKRREDEENENYKGVY